jgi:tRNA uridine 5-carboxymethylaminomethyl modification enzyme
MKYSVNSVWENKDEYDVIVVGAGHAGCEAALATARLGLKTIIFTVSVDSIALMPCNPNIGGTSKGHLVREIDALGGEMARNIDKTFIQSKILNKSKGPAVHSLRAQADKSNYSRTMRNTLESQDNLEIRQSEVVKIVVDDDKNVRGIMTLSGAIFTAKAIILCTGTYLSARCIYGEVSENNGPNGLKAANYLTSSLEEIGIKTRRFKTGTPARVDKRSIDFTKMEEQFGDEIITPFSFETDPKVIQKPQISCWLTYTNERTHDIIRDNLDRSPLFSGEIKGTGPRYCPSIEDKVVKFEDKNRHQVFVEPEGLETNEMYLAGMSSSLPEDVQYKMYRSVSGLENVKIVRNAYAIEYDCIDARQLLPSLEFKEVHGLFSGGQFNGSSGYEEAAAQGLVAGINAARKIKGLEPIILDRSEGYIGVLIDDLVTKESYEPYRMMTSRAEYRLLLRQDNADRRLMPIGHEIGLISDERLERLKLKEQLIDEEVSRLSKVNVGPTKELIELLEKYNSTQIQSGISLYELIKRPELSYEILEPIDTNRPLFPEDISDGIKEQVNIEIKYEGYIKRQERQVNQFKKMEDKYIPADLDYDEVGSLRLEARQKLKEIRPTSVGQASRISGVSPADIAVLLVYLTAR